ncbi:hypothetical protein DFH09DRAFT_1097084 [Mycena vulgaris]|nr:hypothetical protein DFH09DRAFT_1097084 [Mycena vulgaris]
MYHSPRLWIIALKPLSCLLTGFFCLGSQLLSLLLAAPLAFRCVTRVCLFYAYQTTSPGMPQNESVSLDSGAWGPGPGASTPGSMCGPNDALHAQDHTFECGCPITLHLPKINLLNSSAAILFELASVFYCTTLRLWMLQPFRVQIPRLVKLCVVILTVLQRC